MFLQKIGGDYQLVIDKVKDLAGVGNLKESHWMVTSAPCFSFTCDPVFLSYLDSNGDGRIISDDVKAACNWLFKMIRNPEDADNQALTLRLDTINTEQEQGKIVYKAARRILSNLEQDENQEISLTQIRNTKKIVASGARNGDGVIPPQSIENPELEDFVKNVIRTVGSVTDVNGREGVTENLVRNFMDQCKEYLAWIEKGEHPEIQNFSEIMVLGDKTGEAYALLSNLREKIDEFFYLSWLQRSHGSLTGEVNKILPMSKKEPHGLLHTSRPIESSPISIPSGKLTITFDDNLNPEFRNSAMEFKDFVFNQLKPQQKNKSMTLSDWEEIKVLFLPYAEWLRERPDSKVHLLDSAVLKKYVESDYKIQLENLFEKDRQVAQELGAVGDVERLLLYQQLLLEFSNNFVSLARIYDPLRPSLIQVGTLIMDGRRFELTMKIINRDRHKKIVQQSNICVMYLDVTRIEKGKSKTMEIAAAVTSGTMARLFVGKAGVFFSPDGKEWNATVKDFVANPVSIREAVKKPFKQFNEFLSKQAERFGKSRYQDIETSVEKSISTAEQSVQPLQEKRERATENFGGQVRELMLSGSIALAALGSAFAYVTKTLQNVSLMNMVSVIGGLILILFTPLVVMAMFKLRARNLSVFLEACGWAVNGRMRLTYAMGLLFTHEPELPQNIRHGHFDAIGGLLKKIRGSSFARSKWIMAGVAMFVLTCSFGLFCFKKFSWMNDITAVLERFFQ